MWAVGEAQWCGARPIPGRPCACPVHGRPCAHSSAPPTGNKVLRAWVYWEELLWKLVIYIKDLPDVILYMKWWIVSPFFRVYSHDMYKCQDKQRLDTGFGNLTSLEANGPSCWFVQRLLHLEHAAIFEMSLKYFENLMYSFTCLMTETHLSFNHLVCFEFIQAKVKTTN